MGRTNFEGVSHLPIGEVMKMDLLEVSKALPTLLESVSQKVADENPAEWTNEKASRIGDIKVKMEELAELIKSLDQ
jgi:hypothetical protein